MAGTQEIEMLNQGAVAWNDWRRANPDHPVDLSGASLVWPTSTSMPDLRGIDLSFANLAGIYHQKADRDFPDEWGPSLQGANLRNANLKGAQLFQTTLPDADLTGADFSDANLVSVLFARSDLTGASFKGAHLYQVDFDSAVMNLVDFSGATLKECAVWGTSTWDILTNDQTVSHAFVAKGSDRWRKAGLSADSLEMLQLLRHLSVNRNIKSMIDSMTEKMVLILGRFTEKRKEVLDASRDRLRALGFLPVVFDFMPSNNRDLSETVGILGGLSRFVLADLSEAKSIPQELQIIVPHLPSVIVAPIIQSGMAEYSMFEHFRRYPWVLQPFPYESIDSLMSALGETTGYSSETGLLLAQIDEARERMIKPT